MRDHAPDLTILTDRDCLVTFAAMVLCCDNSVRDHEMGYHQGGGTAYITAKGVMNRTGLSRAQPRQLLMANRRRPPHPDAGGRQINPGPATTVRQALKLLPLLPLL